MILIFLVGVVIGVVIGFAIVLNVEGGHKKIKPEPIETDRNMTLAFAITNDNPLWLAVHQAINEIEKETIETARRCSANPSLSNYHLGASEGVTMVRLRLIEKRSISIKELNQKGPNAA